MAKEKSVAGVEVRLLVDCGFGQCNDVATLPEDICAHAVAFGMADSDRDAVAYAKSLQAQG